jgi:hypothetical protein
MEAGKLSPASIFILHERKFMETRDVFEAMQEGEPVGQYVKTLPCKVHVTVMDVFHNNEPAGLILFGEPGCEDSIVRTWSIKEDLFFRRMNKRHFTKGVLKPYKTPAVQEKAEETLEQASDETLMTLLTGHFKRMESAINKTESEAVLFRMIKLARDSEKSEKIIKALETRLAEIQSVQLMGE